VELAPWLRGDDVDVPLNTCGRELQRFPIRHTERLIETRNGLCKTELIRARPLEFGSLWKMWSSVL
jgi:hypothetical protein